MKRTQKCVAIIMTLCLLIGCMATLFGQEMTVGAAPTTVEYNFSQMTYEAHWGVTSYRVSDGALVSTFEKLYGEVKYRLPKAISVSEIQSLTVGANTNGQKTAFKFYDGSGNELFVAYDCQSSGYQNFSIPVSGSGTIQVIGVMSLADNSYSATTYNVSVTTDSGSNSNNNQWGNQGGNNNQGGNTGAVTGGTTIQAENMTKSGQYTGNVSSPFNGVALYANNDAVTTTVNFTSATSSFTLRGSSNNSKAAKVDLVIDNQTKGTFTFNSSNATDVTLQNISTGTGSKSVKLVVTTDDGNWDAYIDYLIVSGATGGNNNQGGNTGNQGGNNNNNQGTVTGGTTVQAENMAKSGQYTGNVSSPFNGVALYANDDAVSTTMNFTSGTSSFTLRGASNNSKAAKVSLVIDNQTKGTFTFNGTNATDATLQNISTGTGNKTVKLVVTTDDGNWDVYIDYLTVSGATAGNNNQGGNTGNQGGNSGNQGGNSQGSNASTLKGALATFGKVGVAMDVKDLQNSSTLNHIKEQYNSITLGNEMKPDYILGWSANTISVSEARNRGYIIPSGYSESTVPVLDFSKVDEVLRSAYSNGLSVRFHTLVWHHQTPAWFFKTNYNANNGYCSASMMDKRLEFYVKNVVEHVSSSQYASVVYAYDVVNEYLNNTDSGTCHWTSIYGNEGTSPKYVRDAFSYANEILNSHGLRGRVKLFYNDYNTYINADNIVKLINFINSNGKLCDGIGMQMHLDVDWPDTNYIATAVDKFSRAGFEIQITEMDITINYRKGGYTLQDQADCYYSVIKMLREKKAGGANITCITFWGLSDDRSWRSDGQPLLYSTVGNKKTAYYSVLEAMK